MNQPTNARAESNQLDRRKFLTASSAFLAVAALATASGAEAAAENSSALDPPTSNTPSASPAAPPPVQRSWGAGWMAF